MQPDSKEPGAMPRPIEPEGSPLWPKHLVDIFIRPRRFFSSSLALGETPYVVLVAWCYGIAAAMDRVDSQMLRSELGRRRPFVEFITESWFTYWGFVLLSGIIGGFLQWWLGGWWYRVRLRWAGDPDPDKRMARLVYIYSAFVWSGPTVAAALALTLAFSNYKEAWDSQEMYSVGLVIFYFWSIVTSYLGARTLFDVSRLKAQVWFLYLPIVLGVVVLGLVATLVAMFGK